jgi:signal transduction histidine kinase
MRRPSTSGAAPVAAYIAHELRNPLATQRALLELALADPDADTATWREIGRDVLDACRQQERLLEACLALGRIQAGLRGAEVELASLAARVLRAADLGGLTARARLEPASTTGVPGLIERLLDNLLANAVRHNRLRGWVAITTRTSGARALLTVENTGPRVPEDELRRLFEPFQQLSTPMTCSAGGLGLGLTIVKSVADAHDAPISVRARAQGGLRVRVSFPLAPQRLCEAAPSGCTEGSVMLHVTSMRDPDSIERAG